MKKNHSSSKYNHLLTLLCLVLVFLDSCQFSEDISPVVTARQWYEQNLGTLQWDAWPHGSTVQSIDWSNAVTNGSLVEVPVKLQGKVTGQLYHSEGSTDGEPVVRLVLWPEGKTYGAAVLQLLRQSGNIPRHLGDMEASGFSGLVLANRGDGRKHAALFEVGMPKTGTRGETAARTKNWECYTVCDRVTISSGGHSVTQMYCDDYCYDVGDWQVPQPPEGGGWTFDYGSVSGGGSATGPWTTALPTNPNHGEIFELKDPSGVITIYVYNATTHTWEIYQINVPEIEVTAQRFPFLLNIPSDFTVLGPDNFLYGFNETFRIWVGTAPSLNNLCGAYLFTSTGDGLTAEIWGLATRAIHSPSGRLLYPMWGSMCITFGSSTIVTNSEIGSNVFNNAWNKTMVNAEIWLNSQTNPTTIQLSQFIVAELRINLSGFAGGYVALTAPGACSGTVIPTVARYCN